MSSSTMDHFFIRSQNNMRRSMPPMMVIEELFDEVLAEAYPGLMDIAVIDSLEGGVREKYGDYVFFGVVELCNKLREDDPFLFHRKGSRKIAEEVKTAFESKEYDMIKQLFLHEAGILTFRLEGCWISKSINKMFSAGMDTWAPQFFPQLERTARVVFIFPANMMNADLVRSICIKDVLANIFVYSGVDVGNGAFDDSALNVVGKRFTEMQSGEIIARSGQRTYFRLKGPSTEFYTDVATFWYAFHKQRADLVVYMTPHRLRGYIQQCHNAAAKEGLLPVQWDDVTRTCGFRTFSGEQLVSNELYREFICFSPPYMQNLFTDAGYSMGRFFECACKFTCLKRERMSECTIKLEDLYYNDEALSAGIERELGLQLVEFTDAVNRAGGTLMPDILCEYLCNLSKLFMRYHRELSVPCSNNMLGLCNATKVVMDKCFCLLGIDQDSHSSWEYAFRSSFGKNRMPADFHIISSSARNEHLNSRFEILSMNVEVAHSSFDKGSIYGDVSVLDTYLSRPDGWVTYDKDDACYVSYFHREWYEPKDISNGSYISLEDPSSLHSIPFASPIEVSVMVIATSEDKDQTYLLANCKGTPNLEQFWLDDDINLKYGTLRCYGRDGRVLLDYVAIKKAVDTKMKLTVTDAKTDLRVSGKILAYYGDDVLGERGFLGQYYALIFGADPSQCIGILKDKPLPLLRSTLAVPAGGKLKIKAHLTDADTDEDIVKGTKEFCASPGSVNVWNIQSKRGSFEFSVN